ncbi:anthranilate synthase component 2 [Coccidioides immitis H538.4]|uniref:Multifunctional tryptophan biosynthesis protein n=1 Tax=Coccidioides immitis H538.4 TaxID=396776 RepID=A0A0J8UFJ1_COCIT|nr:anthranilate synthase component 2 [Coccidioides immitis H538.4]
MASTELVDHSPNHPTKAQRLDNASNVVLIDNYDSFTWNIYQYLILEGATVTVFRNDVISLEELIAKKPTQLVISPGPGHPNTDSGISKEAIQYFAGKIPVFGVCMGEQCIISSFGGEVEVTGEILHGKTSPLKHDGKGVYATLPPNLAVTRYHSLAGTPQTVPECLEVTSWTECENRGGRGIIMGVRHKKLTVEGVQFHPESILTEHGRTMFRNFLKWKGGTWEEALSSTKSQSTAASEPTTSKQMSILEKIYAHRKAAVDLQKAIPSQRPADLQAAYDLGIISSSTSAPSQARKYAMAGAMDQVSYSTIVWALSGISGPKDVEAYRANGVKGVLVGEALMQAEDTSAFVQNLLGPEIQLSPNSLPCSPPLVKICGTRSGDAARAAIEAGADLVVIILAQGRTRTVPDEVALKISKGVKTTPRPSLWNNYFRQAPSSQTGLDYFDNGCRLLRHPSRALLVGVFANQPLSYIISQQQKLGLDIIQLHGSEPIEWARLIPVPVIKKFSPEDKDITKRAYHALPLLDSGVGGTGERLSLPAVEEALERDDGLRIILAGGLNPENLVSTVKALGEQSRKVVGVDVSSGVEVDGSQDLGKIRAFVAAAKGL